jgi:uncharacterized protein
MPKFRVVVDTNVIISAFLKQESFPRRALEAVLADHIFLISSHTTREPVRRLLDARFDRYVSHETRINFLRLLPTLAFQIPTTTVLLVCRDPKDNKFLELAVDGQADSLITGDADLLNLHSFRGVDILTPRAFLEQIGSL